MKYTYFQQAVYCRLIYILIWKWEITSDQFIQLNWNILLINSKHWYRMGEMSTEKWGSGRTLQFFGYCPDSKSWVCVYCRTSELPYTSFLNCWDRSFSNPSETTCFGYSVVQTLNEWRSSMNKLIFTLGDWVTFWFKPNQVRYVTSVSCVHLLLE